MSNNDKLITIRAMKKFGGSFVRALAEAMLHADGDNQARIEDAFPEYMEKYGPDSVFFEATAKVEA